MHRTFSFAACKSCTTHLLAQKDVGFHVQALYADALKATKEHKRAVVRTCRYGLFCWFLRCVCASTVAGVQMYYRQALNLRQRHEDKPAHASNSLSVVETGSSPAPAASMAPDQKECTVGSRSRGRGTARESEAIIAYKVAICYQELRDWEAAVNELEAIPPRMRSATVYNLLGRLYRHMSHIGKAVDAFKVQLIRFRMRSKHNKAPTLHCLLALSIATSESQCVLVEVCVSTHAGGSVYAGLLAADAFGNRCCNCVGRTWCAIHHYH